MTNAEYQMLNNQSKGYLMHATRYALCLLMAVLAAGATLAQAQTFPAQTNSKEILARTPAQLVETLRNPGASVFEKAKACQRLAVVGTKDAIPALVALLPDEKLNIYARFGLEGIPDPAVDEAFRDATRTLHGRQLVGVIDSIGQRKDAQAVGLLKELLGNSHAKVASAAAGALGRIGNTEAAAVLKEALAGNSPVKKCIADGSLACADGLEAAGNKAEAVALQEAVAKADVPKYLKVAALRGQFRLQQGEARDLLLAQIGCPDKAFFNVGLAVARQMPGADVTAALAEALPKLSPERQALLLRALGDRKDAAAASLFLAASKSDSPAIREAAIVVLAKHGDASAAAVLLDAALADAAVAPTAKEGLTNLPGQEVDAAILARLAGADPKAKAVLIELLGARRAVAATAAVRAALSDSDQPVRLAAIAAFGWLAGQQDLDVLIGKALAAGNPAETSAAQTALRMAALRMSERDACAAKLAGSLTGASAANQKYLLELLGRVSGQKALEAVVAGVKSTDPAVKDASARVLGEWLSADAAPALLEIIKSDADVKYRTRALRGYIRIARQLKLAPETRLAMFRTAMELAQRNEEKKIALEILPRIPSAATLGVAVSYLGAPGLKAPAADAAVKISGKLVGRDPKAVATDLQKVVDAKVGGDTGAKAKQLLGQAKAAAK
jgi:HEAT repeat protein